MDIVIHDVMKNGYYMTSSSNRVVTRVTPKGIEYLYKKYRYNNMPKRIEIPEKVLEVEFEEQEKNIVL